MFDEDAMIEHPLFALSTSVFLLKRHRKNFLSHQIEWPRSDDGLERTFGASSFASNSSAKTSIRLDRSPSKQLIDVTELSTILSDVLRETVSIKLGDSYSALSPHRVHATIIHSDYIQRLTEHWRRRGR